MLVVSKSTGKNLPTVAKPSLEFERADEVSCIHVCIWLASLIMILEY